MDVAYLRIVEQGLAHWADPFFKEPQQVNHDDGGRETSLGLVTVRYGGRTRTVGPVEAA